MTGGVYYVGEKSDCDIMQIRTSVKVVDEREESVSKQDSRTKNTPQITVRELPDKEYPGYVKLVVVKAEPNFLFHMSYKDGEWYLSNTLLTQIDSSINLSSNKLRYAKPYVQGPARHYKVSPPEVVCSMVREISKQMCNEEPLNQYPLRQYLYKKVQSDQYLDIDEVYCVMSSSWSYESKNFLTRPRPGLWPKKKTIKCIVDPTRVFLAPVGHKSSPDMDLQWRLSFNVVEKMLIEDFNETQIQCYALLKIFLKDNLRLVSKNILSSYCMKTTMFWLSEREGSDNMVPEKLLHYFVECLKLIQTWLGRHSLPHYFIETRNLLPSNMDPDEVEKLVEAIGKAILQPFMKLWSCESFRHIKKLTKGKPILFPLYSELSYLCAWMEMRFTILIEIYQSVECRLLWKPYSTKNMLECIDRFKQMIEYAQTHPYGQTLLKIFKSCLGFVYFANHSNRLENTKDQISVKEIETLLLEGKDGDLALCPLKLATFYLMQNNISEVLKITTDVLQQRQKIQNRENFPFVLSRALQEQFNLLPENQEARKHLFYIVMNNVPPKTHHEMVCCREERPDVRLFLYFLGKIAKDLTFDMHFMLLESSALPGAVQLEIVFSDPILVEDVSCIGFTISPLVYTLYLRFRAFKAKSDRGGCLVTLSDFQDLLQEEPLLNKWRGYNLLASCYAMMGLSHDAAHSLCCSLKLNPSRNNVAFNYLSTMYRALFL